MHNFNFHAIFSAEKVRYLKKNALLCGCKQNVLPEKKNMKLLTF